MLDKYTRESLGGRSTNKSPTPPGLVVLKNSSTSAKKKVSKAMLQNTECNYFNLMRYVIQIYKSLLGYAINRKKKLCTRVT